eukprot:g13150.t1
MSDMSDDEEEGEEEQCTTEPESVSGEKKKMTLLSDSEEEEQEEGSDDELLDIEKEQEDIDDEKDEIARKQKQYQEEHLEQQAREEEEDSDDLAAVDEVDSDDEMASGDEEGAEEGGEKKTIPKAMDMAKLKMKMEKNIELLNDWKTLGRASKRTRQEVREEIAELITMYYGYNAELATYFLDMFPPEEALAFFEANEKPRPITLRTNTLKTRKTDLAKQLTARGVNVANIGDWCAKEGLKVLDSSVPVGATPEYLAGHYMIQAASSFVPVLALDPSESESILDMAAAPGGKCTHIGQMMKNTGTLYVNELQQSRLSSLTGNIHRLGLTNTIVLNYDGRELRDVLPAHSLDRVLLDAPCSGAGIVARDPSIKSKRNVQEFEQTAQLQKQLLLTAIDLCDAKKSGIIVYSTCSVSVEENEMVVDAILKKRNVKLVDFREEVPFGVPGFVSYREHRFDKTMDKTQRFYPHRHNMDGFFVAKFQKFSNEKPDLGRRERGNRPQMHWGKEQWGQMAENLVEYPAEVEEAVDGSQPKKKKTTGGSDDEASSSAEGAEEGVVGKAAKGKGKRSGPSSAASGKGKVPRSKGDAGANAALQEKMMLFRSGNKAKLQKMIAKEAKTKRTGGAKASSAKDRQSKSDAGSSKRKVKKTKKA